MHIKPVCNYFFFFNRPADLLTFPHQIQRSSDGVGIQHYNMIYIMGNFFIKIPSVFQSACGLLHWCCLVVQDFESSSVNIICNRKRTKIVEL